MTTTTLRGGNLQDLHAQLTAQAAHKQDYVLGAGAFHMDATDTVLTGTAPVITADGVTTGDGRYATNDVFDDGVATRLNIPRAYLRKMRQEEPDLYATNINTWLAGDSRKHLIRTYENGDTRTARALLSDRFRALDNLDALNAALIGIMRNDGGTQVEVDSADLSERRMVVRLRAPQVAAAAPALLRGYRSPFSGATGTDNPTVFAGLVITNSETGSGAFTLVPRLEVEICTNGMVIKKDASRAVHLGARLDQGQINWSQTTQKAALDLITAKAADAVAAFLDPAYLNQAIEELTHAADKTITQPSDTITRVAKTMNYSKEETDTILTHFIQGGQLTAGGIMQAITATAQTLPDSDRAWDMEANAPQALTAV